MAGLAGALRRPQCIGILPLALLALNPRAAHALAGSYGRPPGGGQRRGQGSWGGRGGGGGSSGGGYSRRGGGGGGGYSRGRGSGRDGQANRGGAGRSYGESYGGRYGSDRDRGAVATNEDWEFDTWDESSGVDEESSSARGGLSLDNLGGSDAEYLYGVSPGEALPTLTATSPL